MEQGIYIKIRELYTQIRTLLKPSLLEMHLKSNIMSIYSCICTHNVIEKCFFNMSNIAPWLNVNNLKHYFIFVVQVKIFEVSEKTTNDPFLVHVKIRNLINIVNFRQVKFPPLWQYSFDSDRHGGIKCLENYLSPNSFTVKNRYAMEDVST